MKKLNAFTLIELLIVVLIIAILAAIAIPNFMEFQTRAKTSRAKSDMRTIATALEAYAVDWDDYPVASPSLGSWHPFSARLNSITTPIAYLTSIPNDSFENDVDDPIYDTFDYFSLSSHIYAGGNAANAPADLFGRHWRISSCGPDWVHEWAYVNYDPTNGTVSRGDIIMVQGDGFGFKPATGYIGYQP